MIVPQINDNVRKLLLDPNSWNLYLMLLMKPQVRILHGFLMPNACRLSLRRVILLRQNTYFSIWIKISVSSQIWM